MRSGTVVKVSGAVAYVRNASGDVAEAIMLLPVSVGQKVTVQEVDPPSGQLICIGPINYSEPVYPVDGPAAAPSLRTLGSGAQQAAAGSHTHTPQSFPSDGPAGTASLRTLGTGALQAAAGNHTHVADGAVNVASLRTLGTGPFQAAAGDHAHAAPQVADLPTAIPRGRIAYVERTTSSGSGQPNAGNHIHSLTWTLDSTRAYKITAFASILTSGAAMIGLALRMQSGSTAVTTATQRYAYGKGYCTATIGNAAASAQAEMFIQPGDFASGTYTVGTTGHVPDNGTVTWQLIADAATPTYILIEDIGV